MKRLGVHELWALQKSTEFNLVNTYEVKNGFPVPTNEARKQVLIP